MVGVAPARGVENAGFVHILDRVIAAGHIAIDRGITDRDLGFVARRQQHLAEFVGLRHQQQTPKAGLDVFLCQILRKSFKQRRKRFGHCGTRARNADGIIIAAQRPGGSSGIIKRALGGVFRRQHDAADVPCPQRVGRDGRHNSAVDPA